MKADNLTWDQIKELAEIAKDGGNKFKFTINKDGSMEVIIEFKESNTYVTYPYFKPPYTYYDPNPIYNNPRDLAKITLTNTNTVSDIDPYKTYTTKLDTKGYDN